MAAQAPGLPADELFELSGELQAVANSVDGAQLVAIAHAGSHETRLTERGPVEVRHEVGFVDAMTSSEVSLATGLGQWAAGRRVGLAAALAGRFPRLLETVMAGDVAALNVQKVVTACDGLDAAACAAVEAVLADRLPGMDPARITTLARRVAHRVAADQVAATSAKNKRDRCVQVSPGPDGTTSWWAQLPAGPSAAAWAAVSELGDRYAAEDAGLTLDQARADAFLDLLLTNVTVSAKVTLGIPVITGDDGEAARDAAAAQRASDDAADGSATDGAGGDPACGGLPGATATACDAGAVATGGLGLGGDFAISAALSGCEMKGIGWIDADTVEALLAVVPTDIGRALLDARTGTLVESVSTAYRPPKELADFVATRDGTCRMWGCDRPAVQCDVDHARPWPSGPTSPSNLGGLCRRHHRLKQRRRWTYQLARDGTATWTSPTGRQRVTLPDHAALPPPPLSIPPPPQPPPTPRRDLVAVGPPPF
ncbi:MAG TPA: DUF222 domain-containing protein [Ornithinibacter sp.]|nr:DUF222 domain-containing protein [Ornithinibacter sp.]